MLHSRNDKILPHMQEWNSARAHAHFHKTPWITFHSFLRVWEEGKVSICCSMTYIVLQTQSSFSTSYFIACEFFCQINMKSAEKNKLCQMVRFSVDSSGSQSCTLPDILFKEQLIIIIIIINITVIINKLKLLLKTKCLSRMI